MERVFPFTTIVIQGYIKSGPRSDREARVDLIRDKFNLSYKRLVITVRGAVSQAGVGRGVVPISYRENRVDTYLSAILRVTSRINGGKRLHSRIGI